MMENKKLYSVAALFNTADEITHAAEAVANAGYKDYDVNTPYPVHGMSTKMKIAPSKLGYVALAFGLTGTLLAFLTMYWITVIDYPLVYGGKPFALPPLIPIMFELTVLLASVGTVIVMLFVVFGFPNNSHPLHDTDYIKKVAVDKFGLYIQTTDKLFDDAKVRALFQSLHAGEVMDIFVDDNALWNKQKIFEPKFIVFLICSALLVSGATYYFMNKLLFMSPYNWMSVQNRLPAEKPSKFFEDGRSMRPPVEGTIARGVPPYPYVGQPELAGEKLVNPFLPTKEVLELGKKKFDIYCSPCHGYKAMGDSRLKGLFPNPPSLHSKKVREWQDGRIFHVMTEGQNVMPSYSKQVNPEERWAIVLYIRELIKDSIPTGDVKK